MASAFAQLRSPDCITDSPDMVIHVHADMSSSENMQSRKKSTKKEVTTLATRDGEIPEAKHKGPVILANSHMKRST